MADFDKPQIQISRSYLQPSENSNRSGLVRGQNSNRFPKFCDTSERRKTFEKWPDYQTQNQDDLAEAGFIYTGVGDGVRCFCCGGELGGWEEEDSPWTEHDKMNPSCPHVLQHFVDHVQHTENNVAAIDSTSHDHKDRYSSTAAQTCIQMGCSLECVHGAINTNTERTGDKPLQRSFTIDAGEDDLLTYLPCGHTIDFSESPRHSAECPVCHAKLKGVAIPKHI